MNGCSKLLMRWGGSILFMCCVHTMGGGGPLMDMRPGDAPSGGGPDTLGRPSGGGAVIGEGGAIGGAPAVNTATSERQKNNEAR